MAPPWKSGSRSPWVALHLLDMATGRPLRSWKFETRPTLSIGRADESDVQISDPFVSRLHAELRFSEGQWRLHSLGRSGVLVGGKPVNEVLVEGDLTFRLGPDGPTVQFQPTVAGVDNSMTMFVDVSAPPDVFQLDDTKVSREVGDIAEGEYFQKLQQRAKQMRQKKSEA